MCAPAAIALAAALWWRAGASVARAQTGTLEQGDTVFHDGFEQWSGTDQRVESTWRPWSRSDCDLVWEGNVDEVCRVPEYRQANPMGAYPARVHSGDNAQQYFTPFAGHHAGVLKSFDVPPGATVEVHAWGQAWASPEDDARESDPAANVRMRVGVDPDGGTDPTAPSVVWGAPGNPLDVWREVPPVEVTMGDAGRLTVFLSANPNYPLKHNDIYWDDVTAVHTGTQGPNLPAGGEQGPPGAGAESAPTPADPILEGMVEGAARPGKGGDAGWSWIVLLLGGATAILVWNRKE
jgi:hypothetical protein